MSRERDEVRDEAGSNPRPRDPEQLAEAGRGVSDIGTPAEGQGAAQANKDQADVAAGGGSDAVAGATPNYETAQGTPGASVAGAQTTGAELETARGDIGSGTGGGNAVGADPSVGVESDLDTDRGVGPGNVETAGGGVETAEDYGIGMGGGDRD